MSRLPLIVLADDLTGAAEIAAIAHTAGLRAVICTTPPARIAAADVLIFDTDTRLDAPAKAARRVRATVSRLRRVPHAGVFKKTDSVLRGPVLAELTACAAALGLRRALLVPCNPSLGRIIRDGRYYVAGQPIDTTAFSRDPHHPRQTADVLQLLGASRKSPAVCLPPRSRLPRKGIIVGEAESPSHVTAWAGQVGTGTLAAGGADFFRAWLQTRRRVYRATSNPYRLPVGGVLLVNGTIAAPTPIAPFATELVGINASRPASVRSLVSALKLQLVTTGFAAVTTSGPVVQKSLVSNALMRTFVQLAAQLHASGSFSHLLVAGGATSAGILHELNWTQFEVVHVWGPGVITLQPTAAPDFVVTVKPGSYPWPASLAQELDAGVSSRSHESPRRYTYAR